MANLHRLTVGDTLTALLVQLKQRDASGVLAVVDVTGLTVKFKMVDSAGTTKVALTASNVTVTGAANGKVQYDFQADDVDTAGRHYAWFVVEDGSSEKDTYPADGRSFIIEIAASEGDT